MLSLEPSVVIVDDKYDEVIGIINEYQKHGIGIKYYNAHLTESDPKPLNHFSNLNLIFLDVHFTDDTRDYDPEHCAAWIYHLVPENSFYIMVLWSKETDKEDEILDKLRKINREPFLIFAEQKTDYQIEGGWDFKRLNNSINSKLDDYPELNELSIWKKSILNSSNIVIGHLSKNINVNSLRKKLQKIIINHGGNHLLGSDKIKQKREVLLDALDSILTSNSKVTRPKIDISAKNKSQLYEIKEFPDSDIDSGLNSWFHFKLIEKNIEPEYFDSGLISYFKNISLRKNYTLINDKEVKKYLTHQISGEKKILDIAVIISRPCDIAQNKFGRNLKFLSGLLIIEPSRTTKHKFKGKDTKPLSIKVYDHLSLSDTESNCALLFDFRYSFSLPPDIFEERFEKVKVFNKELISEIQVEYSSYSSRLGITQII